MPPGTVVVRKPLRLLVRPSPPPLPFVPPAPLLPTVLQRKTKSEEVHRGKVMLHAYEVCSDCKVSVDVSWVLMKRGASVTVNVMPFGNVRTPFSGTNPRRAKPCRFRVSTGCTSTSVMPLGQS